MTNFTNIDAVLFDMDGTLIEHTWQLSQITDAMCKRFQDSLAPLTCNEFYDVFWAKNADMWFMMVDGVVNGDTAQVYSYINTLRALEKDISIASTMVDYWTELVLKEAVPFDDTAEVLRNVSSKFTTGIVTNGFTTLQRAKIARYGLEETVDFTLVSEEAGYHKPDTRLFQHALKLAGNIQPDRAIMVGDTLTADIEGAHNAGLKTVFINPRDDQTPPNHTPKIKCLSELLTILDIKTEEQEEQ